MTTTHVLNVPGARLYYEVRGTGPLLLVTAAPMAAAAFAALAEALAGDHTVVTHDPRGISGSTLDDPDQDSTPEVRADDVVALINALGAESVDVFGTSGGAVTGLALVARHPGRVRTLIAHEPPLLELLPEAAERRRWVEDLIGTFHREGQGPAWKEFLAAAGFDDNEDVQAEPPREPSAQALADGAHFFAHEIRGTTCYVPDIAALKSAPTRIIVGIGADSGGLDTYRASTALAQLLSTRPVEFPGDHAGFLARPQDFATTLRAVLTDEGAYEPFTR
jgi:pimeloyl-ACP methyl ester carboxylesterase